MGLVCRTGSQEPTMEGSRVILLTRLCMRTITWTRPPLRTPPRQLSFSSNSSRCRHRNSSSSRHRRRTRLSGRAAVVFSVSLDTYKPPKPAPPTTATTGSPRGQEGPLETRDDRELSERDLSSFVTFHLFVFEAFCVLSLPLLFISETEITSIIITASLDILFPFWLQCEALATLRK